MVSNGESGASGGTTSQLFQEHLVTLFNILSDGEPSVSTPSLIQLWQLSDYAVSFALIDAFQKYSGYDNRLGFEQFSEAVRHCLTSCEPYAAAAGELDAGSADDAVGTATAAAAATAAATAASESGYRTFDSSRSLEPAAPPPPVPKHAPHRPPLRVHSDSGVLDREFDGRPRPLRPPDYETYMNNSLDWGSCGSGNRRSRLKPPVPPRMSTASCGNSSAQSSPPVPPAEASVNETAPTAATTDFVDGLDADDYETLISAARGPPPLPPPPPNRPASLMPAHQPPQPAAKERHRARSPMKRLMQAFTRPLSRSQSFRLSRPTASTAQQQPSQPPPVANNMHMHHQHQQQQQPLLTKFASYVENPDRFSGSYHARGALLRERLRCVRQAYECVEACRQSLVAQIADLQSQLAGCPSAEASSGSATAVASNYSTPSAVNLSPTSPTSATTAAAAGRLLADQEARIQRLEREKSQLLRTLLQTQALG